MANAEYQVQVSLKAALDALSPIGSLGTVPVYDHVPQDQTPLFIAIGEDTNGPDDTKSDNGIEHLLEINIYSSYRGLAEVKEVMGAIYTALHKKPLAVAGFGSTGCRYRSSTEFIEPDGSRGVMRFELTTYI